MKKTINKIILTLLIFITALLIGNKVNAQFYYAGTGSIENMYSVLKDERRHNWFCIENRASINSNETIYFNTHTIRIEGKTAKLYAYINDNWVEQASYTDTINAKMARILAEPDIGYNIGTSSNVVISYKQYAIWNTVNEWIESIQNNDSNWGLSALKAETNDLPTGATKEAHYRMTTEQVQKGDELLETATNYANNLDTAQQGVINNTGNVTFERVGDKIKVGPFNWSFAGTISNLKINGTYDVNTTITSGQDFYLEVPNTFTGISTVTGTLSYGGQYTVDIQLLEVTNSGNHGANAQNIMYTDYTGELQTINFSFSLNIVFEGNLKIVKVVNGNESIKLNGVGFKIKVDGTNNYLVKNSDGTISYNGTENNCTEFVTGIDGAYGEISINGIFVGKYIAYETTNPNYGYVVEPGNQTVITINPGSTTSQTIGNTQRYVKLSGFVWKDIQTGKQTVRNNLYRSDENDDLDEAFNGIKVKLVGSSGNIIATTETSELGLYSEINGGEYIFNDVEIAQLSNYHIEFEYDGLLYQSVAVNLDSNIGSKATDSVQRDILDRTFKNIEYNGQNGVSVNNGTYNITYNSTVDHKTSILDSSACTLNANTGHAGYDIASQYVVGSTTEIRYINLGIYERPQTDIALAQDLDNVKLGVNGYWHVYKYGNRSFDEDSGSWNVGVKFKNEYTGSYKRAVYKSDIEYQSEDNDKNLQVYLTYKVAIKNESTYIVNVSKIVDYFDSRYQLVAAGKGLDDNKNITSAVNYEAQTEYNSDYNRTIINVNTTVNPGESDYVYVQFKLDKQAVLAIINNNETLENMAEIYTYSVYKNENGDTVAALDKDSVPGNAQIGNTDTYEDDTDSAPPVLLELTDARAIAGTVFVDSTADELKTNEIREGNGIFDNGEETLTGVTVTLHELNNAIDDMTTETDENGNYTFEGYIPGQYTITYTWGNKTYTVQDYKGTVYSTERNQGNMYWYKENADTRYTDAIDIYSERIEIDNQMAKITNNTIRTIVDNAYEGQNPDGIITTMDAITPTMEFGVEYETTETSGVGDQVKFVVNNVDFGIVERARQQLDMEKRVSAIKITLTDGTVLINATVNEDGSLSGVNNYLTNMVQTTTNGNRFNGYIKAEIDNEKIEGSTLEITYEIKAINNSECDYMSEGYYTYGSKYNGNKGNLVTLRPSAVVDYLDKGFAFDASKNADWEQITIDKLNNLNAQKIGDTEYLNNKILLYTEATVKDLKPGEEVAVALNVSTLLTTTDDISFDNDVETVIIEKPTENVNSNIIISQHIGSIVRYFPTASSEQVQVVPSTGENRAYVVPTVIGIVALVVLGCGVFIIKKKVIDKK